MPRCKHHMKNPTVKLWGAIVFYHHNLINGSGLHWLHAGPKGKVLLKTEVSWRNINGILIRTPDHQLFLHFRRIPRCMAKRAR